ncbi:MAG: twin-arginine translocation signal domain-containing protein, partial [Leisingera sp.]
MTERKPKAALSRRTFLTTSLAAGVSAAALAAGTGQAMAAADLSGREMVFASWGGSYQAAQEAAYCNPFMEKSGAVVIQDGPMSGSKLRTMVEG